MAAGGRGDFAPDGALALRVSPPPDVSTSPHAELRPGAGVTSSAGATPGASTTSSVGASPSVSVTAGAPVAISAGAGPLTFTRLKWTSFFHSVVYLSLIVCAIARLAGPTLILGWTHGILWIVMSLACIAAVRRRVIPLRVGVAVAVLGGLGPFVGSYEFVREQRRRTRDAPAPDH